MSANPKLQEIVKIRVKLVLASLAESGGLNCLVAKGADCLGHQNGIPSLSDLVIFENSGSGSKMVGLEQS